MFRQILRLSQHSIIYGLGAAVSSIVGFFLLPLYTRYLTTSDYGNLEILLTTSAVLTIVAGMGLSTALFRSYFLHDDADKRKAVLSTAFLFLTASSAILCLLLIAIAGSISSAIFGSTEYALHFRLVFLTLFCDTCVALGLSVLRAREKPVAFAGVAVTRVLVSIGLNLVFVVALHRGVLGIVEASAIASALIYLIMAVTLFRQAGIHFSVDELKRMLAFGLPLIPAGLGGWILTLSDRYFLKFLSTADQVGLYSLGYKFGGVLSALVVAPILTAWAPFAFSVWREKDARQVYSRVFTYFLLVALFAALALAILSREVLAIMATPDFFAAYRVIPLIALAYVVYGCFDMLAIGIGLMAKTRYTAAIVAAAAVLNLGLNYVLVPHYGMMGSAWATLVSYVALTTVGFLVSRRFYAVKYEWGRIAKMLLAAGAIYAGSLFISNTYAVVHSYVIVGVFKLLALLTFPVVLYFLGFYHTEEILKAKAVVKALPGYVKSRLRK